MLQFFYQILGDEMFGWVILGVISFVFLVCLITLLVCFFKIFYSAQKKLEVETKELPLPEGSVYEPFHEMMTKWILEKRNTPHRACETTSFDGLKLRAKYYEFDKNAPIEIMLHGYRGSSERDLCGGVDRCQKLNHNVLIVDSRASSFSGGRVISFGINESKDCEKWIDFVLKEINPNAKIILSGVSMGASTVMICASKDLPKNVVGIIADCGYTSASEIIKKVIDDMKLPSKILFPFAKLSAKIFGKFNLEETSSIDSLKNCKLPVIFFHGDKDDFVPLEMSKRNYEACVSRKKLVIIEGAGHGLAFPVAQEKYVNEIKEFFKSIY